VLKTDVIVKERADAGLRGYRLVKPDGLVSGYTLALTKGGDLVLLARACGERRLLSRQDLRDRVCCRCARECVSGADRYRVLLTVRAWTIDAGNRRRECVGRCCPGRPLLAQRRVQLPPLVSSIP